MSTSWMERAKQRFSRMPVNSTDKTAKTRVSSVSSVQFGHTPQKMIGVSSVLAVRFGHIPQKSHFSNQAQNDGKNADGYMSESSGKPGQNLKKPEAVDTADEKLMRLKVLRAALRVCDLWGDGEAARQATRDDIAAVPADQLPDMYEHYVSAYSAFKGMPQGHLKDISKLMKGKS